MQLFDFHHHKKNSTGTYNLERDDETPEKAFSAGIHPADITENYEAQLAWFYEKSSEKNCIAIGECGLDGIVKTDYTLQKNVFREQIIWAEKIRKPVIIHCVRKFHDLPEFRKISEVPMIIHGFNKKNEVAKQLLKQGFYLSFGSALLYSLSLQQCFKKISSERFFLETDNADVEIAELYQKAAELRNCSVEEIILQINSNIQKITQL